MKALIGIKPILTLFLVSCFFLSFNSADERVSFPGEYTLFKIDRSRDPDLVIYDVNLNDQGMLDQSMPITVYWQKKSKSGQKESLTGIQKKFGYGLKFHTVSEHMADFQFVSYFNRMFELRKSKVGQYRVFTLSEGKRVEVTSMYIHFGDDSFWFPDVSRVELYGLAEVGRDPVKEIIIP